MLHLSKRKKNIGPDAREFQSASQSFPKQRVRQIRLTNHVSDSCGIRWFAGHKYERTDKFSQTVRGWISFDGETDEMQGRTWAAAPTQRCSPRFYGSVPKNKHCNMQGMCLRQQPQERQATATGDHMHPRECLTLVSLFLFFILFNYIHFILLLSTKNDCTTYVGKPAIIIVEA